MTHLRQPDETTELREFEFVISYDPGVDELMDVYRTHPSLSAWSSVCFATPETMWRIDHVKGERDALDAHDAVFLDDTRCNECLDAPNCDTTRHYHVLDDQPNSRTVYTFRREVHRCHSVPYIVMANVGDGCVFRARRTDDEYRWKVLYPAERSVSDLHDRIEDDLRDGLSLDVERLTLSGNWSANTQTAAELSHGHWTVLEAARELGYYERPRNATVEEISDYLGVPRSTVQYRLRTAEDRIMTNFIENTL